MSSQIPDNDLPMKQSKKVGVGLTPGLSSHHAGRLTPLALANARRKIDPTVVSIAVSGLSQSQIEAVDFTAIFKLDRCRAALLSLFAKRP